MAFKPIMIKDVYLRLGDEALGETYQCQATSVTLTPDAKAERLKTVCPSGRYSDVDDPEWELEVGYVYGEDDGAGTKAEVLADFLLDNHGTKVPFLFKPRNGGVGYEGEVTVLAGPVGGKQGAWSEGSVKLPVEGQPTRVPATAGSEG